MKFLAINNELLTVISVLDRTQRVYSDEKLSLLSNYYLDPFIIFFFFKLHYLFLTSICSDSKIITFCLSKKNSQCNLLTLFSSSLVRSGF